MKIKKMANVDFLKHTHGHCWQSTAGVERLEQQLAALGTTPVPVLLQLVLS